LETATTFVGRGPGVRLSEIDPMKVTIGLAAAVSAGMLLAGCASGSYYGPGPDSDALAYDGYYDGSYGPVYDGYWRGDHFWYRDGAGHPFRRDEARHFSRRAVRGFQHIHGERGAGGKGHGRP
jgi:hypothetical protein